MATLDQVYNRRALEKEFSFSQAVRANGFLFISGCVSWDLDGNPLHPGDWAAQVREVYNDIEATLRAEGMDFSNVVKETVFCRDMDALIANNGVRAEYYKLCTPPASTWIQISRLVHEDLLLEVEIVAQKR